MVNPAVWMTLLPWPRTLAIEHGHPNSGIDHATRRSAQKNGAS